VAASVSGSLQQAPAMFACALGLAALCLPPATAQAVRDPTVAPSASAAPADAGEAPAASRPASRLQMVIRGPDDARAAVVDGALVRVGDTVVIHGTPARVVRIGDDVLVFSRDGMRETLALLPALKSPPAGAGARCAQPPC
jgi:hypothetical protein